VTVSSFLLFTDLHAHPHKKSEQRLNDCLETLKWVFETAKKNNIKNILFGGDFFHDRNKIDLLTCHQTFSLMKNYLDGSINLYLVLGNHDLWYYEKTSVSAVTMFSSLPNVTIIDKPQSMRIDGIKWHLIPFTHDPTNTLQALDSDIDDKTFLLGHLAIDGARLNSAGSISEVEIEHDGDMIKINKSLFSRYKSAFLGHYHGYQTLSKNLEYIGSPLQLSFGEANETKHILHLKIEDTGEYQKEYIENEFSPRHYCGTSEQLLLIPKKFLEKAFITLISSHENKQDIAQEIEELEKSGIKTIKVKKQVEKDSAEDTSTVQTSKSILENTETMVEQYVKHLNPTADHEKLIKIGKIIVSATNLEDE
jgi:DNA repair exonuclease SbcCD nuclease subunit